MREIQYKKFSWDIHKKNWRVKQPNVCQFELTFRCGLHCKHCYTDCYNKDEYLERELSAVQVKRLLDKIYNSGVIWLCFTGGDPLTRDDFLEIYSYAKEKGFIITIFTNGYSMTKEILDYLKNRPPFVIEITLNAVTKKTYEDISQVKGSFEKVMHGVDMIAQNKLPLKIKTQVMRHNLEELPKIKEFVEGLGLRFRPSIDLYASLDRGLSPCNSRISPQEALKLDKRLGADSIKKEDGCNVNGARSALTSNPNLFRCAAGGGDGINLDPYGNMFLCSLIREPCFNLLEAGIEDTVSKLLSLVRGKRFTTSSRCKECKIHELCHSCPGRALLEIGDMEAPVEYYCELAHLIAEKRTAKLLNG